MRAVLVVTLGYLIGSYSTPSAAATSDHVAEAHIADAEIDTVVS
jgi:hypothetical protein